MVWGLCGARGSGAVVALVGAAGLTRWGRSYRQARGARVGNRADSDTFRWQVSAEGSLDSEQLALGNSHQRPKSKWYGRATRQEIGEIEAIDQLMANLRNRRKKLINRTTMRTQVWVERHGRSAQHGRNRRRTVSPL